MQLWRVMVCTMGFTVLPMLPPPGQGTPGVRNEQRYINKLNESKHHRPSLPSMLQTAGAYYVLASTGGGLLNLLVTPQSVSYKNIALGFAVGSVCLGAAECIRRKVTDMQYRYYDAKVDDAEKKGWYCRPVVSNSIKMGTWLLSCTSYGLLTYSIMNTGVAMAACLIWRFQKMHKMHNAIMHNAIMIASVLLAACSWGIVHVVSIGAGIKADESDLARHMHKKGTGVIQVKIS